MVDSRAGMTMGLTPGTFFIPVLFLVLPNIPLLIAGNLLILREKRGFGLSPPLFAFVGKICGLSGGRPGRAVEGLWGT
jgi:hypothetical protein